MTEIVVTNNPDERRYEAHLGDELAGFAAYRLSDGLIRDETQQLPSATVSVDPSQGGVTEVLAPEVKSLAFQYFDGTNWTTSWDTTNTSAPVAIQVTMGVKLKRPRGGNVDSDGVRTIVLTCSLPLTCAPLLLTTVAKVEVRIPLPA